MRTVAIALVAVCAIGCGSHEPKLEGTWVGSYAMFPAIFDFKGDTVGVTLAGKYQQDVFEHHDSAGTSIVHVIRPNVWFKMIFIREDSAVVIVNARERIAVQKQ